MAKDKFILVSLQEDESKEIAQIISNKSSRKILDYLAEKEATESELSEKLDIPLSTVHYNLQGLVKGKLVEADEYHYSKKGREVLHYKLANKYIVIAPKSTFGIKEKLKSILPVGIFALMGSGALLFFERFGSGRLVQSQDAVAMIEAAPKAVRAAGDQATFAVSQVAEPVMWNIFHEPALWFLIGCVFTLVLLIAVEYMKYKKK